MVRQFFVCSYALYSQKKYRRKKVTLLRLAAFTLSEAARRPCPRPSTYFNFRHTCTKSSSPPTVLWLHFCPSRGYPILLFLRSKYVCCQGRLNYFLRFSLRLLSNRDGMQAHTTAQSKEEEEIKQRCMKSKVLYFNSHQTRPFSANGPIFSTSFETNQQAPLLVFFLLPLLLTSLPLWLQATW